MQLLFLVRRRGGGGNLIKRVSVPLLLSKFVCRVQTNKQTGWGEVRGGASEKRPNGQAVPHDLEIIRVSVSSFLCKRAAFEGGSVGRLDWDGGEAPPPAHSHSGAATKRIAAPASLTREERHIAQRFYATFKAVQSGFLPCPPTPFFFLLFFELSSLRPSHSRNNYFERASPPRRDVSFRPHSSNLWRTDLSRDRPPERREEEESEIITRGRTGESVGSKRGARRSSDSFG